MKKSSSQLEVSGRHRRAADAPDLTTFEDVCYFRALVACLEAGGEDLWDLPCARLALAAIERRWRDLYRNGVNHTGPA